MTTPGRLHLIATLALLVTLAGIGLAQAGLMETPVGGWGIDRPAPMPAPETHGPGPTRGGLA